MNDQFSHGGVKKESMLGPVFLSLFKNGLDLESSSELAKFADDTVLFR